MLAFVSAEAPSGIIYNGVRLMVGPRGKRWIAMPDVKRRDENDQVVLTAARMPIYDPVIEFSRPRYLRPIRRHGSRCAAPVQPRIFQRGAGPMTAADSVTILRTKGRRRWEQQHLTPTERLSRHRAWLENQVAGGNA